MQKTWIPLLAAVSCLPLGATPAPAADVPPLVQQAMEHNAQDTAGIVAFEARASTDFSGPGMRGALTWRAWVVQRDGRSIKTKLLALSRGGQPSTAANRERMETQMNLSPDTTDMPFDKRYAAAYVFGPPQADGSDHVLSFRSLVRDKDHGDGKLVFDKNGHVKRVSYTPNVMPPHASSANVVLTLGSIGPSWWGVTRFNAEYGGGFGPMQGHMGLDQAQVSYHRFASLEAALAAAPKGVR